MVRAWYSEAYAWARLSLAVQARVPVTVLVSVSVTVLVPVQPMQTLALS